MLNVIYLLILWLEIGYSNILRYYNSYCIMNCLQLFSLVYTIEYHPLRYEECILLNVKYTGCTHSVFINHFEHERSSAVSDICISSEWVRRNNGGRVNNGWGTPEWSRLT